MLETFEDILPIFGVICSGSVQPLSCGIWLTYGGKLYSRIKGKKFLNLFKIVKMLYHLIE